jgi:tetratricopeptide (TPR) repeat protein
VDREARPANMLLAGLIEEAGISRKGLARRVVELGNSRGLQGLRYDHSSVARWLSGQQPSAPVPELIAEVLTGLVARRVAVTDAGMRPSDMAADTGLQLAGSWQECVAAAAALCHADLARRRFLQDSVLAVSMSSAAALQWLVSPAAEPPAGTGRRRIGASDITAISMAAGAFREMDNRLGGGRTRGALMHYVTTEVVPLLAQAQFSPETGRRVAGQAAQLAQLAGWMAYDAGLHGHADRYLTVALSFARQAADYGLGAEILSAKAHQAIYLARPADAIDLARAAQVTARRAGSMTLLAECQVMEAHGHAARHDPHACARALSQAENAFGQASRDDDPAWLRYFDEAYLAALMARCFRDLGDPSRAETYARRSLDMDNTFVRGRAFNLSLLATVLAEQGDVEQACARGSDALDITVTLSSARSIRYLADLGRALRPAASSAVVRDFTGQLAERLPAASGRARPPGS